MSVTWLVPLALSGMALLVLPVLIHLLARHQATRVLFPSLRFLPSSRVAALSRRTISEWLLLALRLSIVAAAVAAAAAPVFISNARRDAWNARIARAIVIAGDSPEAQETAGTAREGSFVSAQFAAPVLADALRSAAEWLAEQPPAGREVVIVGDLREGALMEQDLGVLTPGTGIRFLPVVSSSAASQTLASVADAGGRATAARLQVEARLDGTRVARDRFTGSEPNVRVVAAPSDQTYADALVRAVMREGVVFDASRSRSVRFEFQGAPRTQLPDSPPQTAWMRDALEHAADARGGEVDGVLVVHPAMTVIDSRAPAFVSRVLQRALAPPMEAYETRRVSPAALVAWARPSGGSPDGVLPANEGDYRWFWGAALVLLGVEQLVRRRGARG